MKQFPDLKPQSVYSRRNSIETCTSSWNFNNSSVLQQTTPEDAVADAYPQILVALAPRVGDMRQAVIASSTVDRADAGQMSAVEQELMRIAREREKEIEIGLEHGARLQRWGSQLPVP